MHLPRLLAGLLIVGAAGAALVMAAPAANHPDSSLSSSTCSRAAIARSVVDFIALVDARRFDRVERLWLPRRRLATPGFFNLGTGPRTFRATLGADVPRAARPDGSISGLPRLRLVLLDPRPAPEEPARSGYSLIWIRFANDSESVTLGRAKGVWDCPRRRIAMFVGSERPFATKTAALASLGRPCGARGLVPYARAGQRLVLCGAPRAG